MKNKRLRSFLWTQASALIVGVVTTVGSLYLAITFVSKGISSLSFSQISGFQETLRGIPNPGGSAAFGLIFLPVVATFCWWGIISDWKSLKEEAENKTSNKNNKEAGVGDSAAE